MSTSYYFLVLSPVSGDHKSPTELDTLSPADLSRAERRKILRKGFCILFGHKKYVLAAQADRAKKVRAV